MAPDAAALEQLAALHGSCEQGGVLPPRAAAAAEDAYASAVACRPGAASDASGNDDGDDDGDEAGLTIAAADLDVLPPARVTLLITNAGVLAPGQAGRVLEELYG